MTKKELKKMLIGGGIAVFCLSLLHWGVMFKLHDLPYWYTWEGIKIEAIVLGVDWLVLHRPAKWYLNKVDTLMKEVESEERA